MQLDFAFLCDHADGQGKLSAIGIGLDTVFAPVLPINHRIAVVCQLKASTAEAGQKQFVLDMIGEDGQQVLPVKLEVPLEMRPPPGGLRSTARICVVLEVTFQRYGNYSAHILVDNNEMASLDFRVAEPPKTT